MKRIIIFGSVGLILIFFIICIINNSTEKTTNLSKEGVMFGSYFDKEMKGEVVIYENGTARYYPDITSVSNYTGEYTILEGKLTINTKDRFCEFVIDGEKLLLSRYKDISGDIVECKEENVIYRYHKDFSDIIYRENGEYRSNRGLESLKLGKIEATFSLSSTGNHYVKGNYVIENDKLVVKGKNGNVEFLCDDGKLILSRYWYSGIFYEYAYGEKVFEFTYYGDEVMPKDDILIYNDLQEVECYYNSDYSSEIIIYENGIARYCPSTDCGVSYCGEYYYEDDMMILKEVESIHIFKEDGENFILTEYTDYQGKVRTCEGEEYIFTKSNTHINKVRSGKYCDGKGNKVYLDGEGNMCIHLLDTKNISDVSEIGYTKLQGEYAIDNYKILFESKEGTIVELILESGNLMLGDYKFMYCYGD